MTNLTNLNHSSSFESVRRWPAEGLLQKFGVGRELVALLPCAIEVMPSVVDDGERQLFPVAVWRSGKNECERAGETTECETASGIYFGDSDPSSPNFCPRHYFEQLYGPDAYCSLTCWPVEWGSWSDEQQRATGRK